MTLQQWIVRSLESPSVARRSAGIVLKGLLEGVVFALFGLAFGALVYALAQFAPVEPYWTSLSATSVGTLVAVWFANENWCYLTTPP